MSTLPSGLPEHIDDTESLARFLTSSGHYNSLGVKPAAFLPNPVDNQTSVFRHGPEPDNCLWDTGKSVVKESGKNLHGAAFVSAGDIRAVELDVLSKEPPPRHANLTNWPSSDVSDFAKAAQKEIALVLAEKAVTVMLS